ncbi:MAG: dTMP kinase [Candidatus Goldbacteria bacterium]|nr:dTMP kinase [Candidatus Goldiibacteriota bacterium]
MTIKYLDNHPFHGILIAVEGIDGSGKSTQLRLLQEWLKSMEYQVFFTEWNSSELVNETIRKGKKKNLLTPITFSILHATDFADRLNHLILPPLKAGMIVLADRYIYTAFARDVVRGVDPGWVRDLYGFAIKPNLTFYFKVDIETSIKRILTGRKALKYYEAGMDMKLHDNPVESFKIFQGRILNEYEKICKEYNLIVIDALMPINNQQKIVRDEVKKLLEQYNPEPLID